MSKYPAQIDNDTSLPKVVDNLSPAKGDSVNRLRAAIIAIENELGVKPSGVYSTVRARLDALEGTVNGITTTELGGDLEGFLFNPTVAGIKNRPISDVAPSLNQVLTWNGIAWEPASPSTIVLDVLPTSVLLPADISFLAGDGYTASSSPTRIGARIIDLNLFPLSYPDGRVRTIKFIGDLEVTNPNTTAVLQIKNITNNIVIYNSQLQSSSVSSEEVSAIIYGGDASDGYLSDDCCDLTMYEAQLYLLNSQTPSDLAICRNARIEFTYSPPILVTALVPLALPTDLNFVAGYELNGFTTPAGIGGRKVDMTKFPIALSDGRIRNVKFMCDVEISAPGVDGYIQLWDTTHNVLVTGTQFHFTNLLVTEYSSTLTVGSANGNLRNDVTARYEVRIWKVSGSPTDRVICNNARIQVTYAL